MGTTTTTFVDFTTNFGDIVIELYNSAAPQTVADFLSYAENMTVGAGYEDSFFHRLAAGFVLQGGGYDVSSSGTISAIMTGTPVQNEYSDSRPNVAGTVALAKVGNDPNSGTDQFFINLADNSQNLDNQNGGFTVFGTVTPASWDVVEAIAGLPTVNAGGAFTNLPVQGTVSNNAVTTANLVLITDVTVSDTAPCYRSGTRIRTLRGEIPVECLRPGDQAVTASGAMRPIRWLGHRRIACTTHPNPELVRPVRIAAGAFADGIPARDLFLSPDHAVFTGGALIPIRHLINFSSIAPVAVDDIEYWHVELDRHDVLLAEGLPAESYLDTGNRSSFANGGAIVQLHPSFAALSWDHACAPLMTDGPQVVAEKRRLFARAGADAARDLSVRLRASGRTLAATPCGTECWHIAIPARARHLELLSTPWHPAAFAADSLDRRQLGVRVLALALDDQPIGLEDAAFAAGFHPVEPSVEGAGRWTDGAGRLALPRGVRHVTLRLADGARPARCAA